MERFILGFTGPARCGKDTAGQIASEEFGFTQMAFATPIKTHVATIFGWDDRHTHGELKDVVDPYWGFSPRKAMQVFGTEFGRGLSQDLWVKLADGMMVDGGVYVITDVRFENEAKYVREHGILTHIWRDDCQKVESHSSESGVTRSTQDYIYGNNGTLLEFQTAMRSFIRMIDLTLRF